MTSDHENDAILAEQIAYYDARAAEYDELLVRVFDPEWQDLVDALLAAHFTGDVLELACGTGVWTEPVARTATHVTAIDASPAMIAANRARLSDAGLLDRVTYRQADLFAWRPDRTFDAVVIGFFLSHVPDDRLDPLLAAVANALSIGGRLFVVDTIRDLPEPTSDAAPPPPSSPLTIRRLKDGRHFRIVKICRSQTEFTEAFARHGIAFEGHETEIEFVYGIGRKTRVASGR
jgi:ubiquinone/menaquinone biosynthesis C-methylase UbiE